MNATTVLLVDDDADLLDVMGQRCRSMGLNVEHARNLLTATRAIEKRRPDLICVDVNLPTGNGLEFCESLSSDPATAGIPIIVLSGQQTPEPVDVCRRLGIPFVAKGPNAWERLEPLLQHALVEGQLLRAALETHVRPGPRTTHSVPLPPDGLDESAVPHISASTSPSSKTKSLQIVVADDDRDLVHFLTQRFASLGCSVMGVTNAVDAINVIHRIAPHLVVLDVNMPDGNGLSVCEMMATDERLRTTPVIVLTGRSDESTIRRCHDMLVFYVQKGTQIWDRIEPLVRELLRLPEPEAAWVEPPTADEFTAPARAKTLAKYHDELMDAVFAMLSPEGDASETVNPAPTVDDSPPWVLCIDDDADFSDAIKVRLEQHGVAVVRAFSGMEGYRMAFTSPAAAIVLDYHMPNGQGDYVLDRLKSNPVTKDIPVFVVTGTQDKVLERRMRAMGAASYLQKPVDFDELRAQMSVYIDILAGQSTPPFATAHP